MTLTRTYPARPQLQHCCVVLVLVLLILPVAAATDNGLLDSVRSGDIKTIQSLLKGDVDINTAEADGTTALHWASHLDNMKVADMLVDAGADVNATSEYGVTPLWLACTNRSAGMVIKLLEAGADPDNALWTGETILMNCSRTGTLDGVLALLEHGADIEARENLKGQTALMWAAAGGHSDVAKVLVENGANISNVSTGGFSPLLFAARSGDIETARVLIAAGSSPDEFTPAYGHSLLVASAGGHEDLALYLLEAGADPDAVDQNGISALHYAIRAGFSALNGVRYDEVYRVRPSNMARLAKALLEAGADPNVQIKRNFRLGPDGSPFNMAGATPFFLAAVSADIALMRLLEEYEADPQLNASGGVTPLMAAARAACTGSCAFQGGNKATEAEVNQALQAVTAVVQMGVDVNAADVDGQTAMHMAAFTGADVVVQYLAENGANVNVRNNYGETPWSMASGISPVLRYRGLYGSHETTAALLEKLGATRVTREELDPNAPAPPGQ